MKTADTETPRVTRLWHVTANSSVPAHPMKDDWFAYRQYTPTDALAHDHD